MNPASAYLAAAQAILDRISATQLENIQRAADICVDSIAGDGLVHLFGTGHSRMFVEEMYPRHGSFPGFHSIVELSLTFLKPGGRGNWATPSDVHKARGGILRGRFCATLSCARRIAS